MELEGIVIFLTFSFFSVFFLFAYDHLLNVDSIGLRVFFLMKKTEFIVMKEKEKSSQIENVGFMVFT